MGERTCLDLGHCLEFMFGRDFHHITLPPCFPLCLPSVSTFSCAPLQIPFLVFFNLGFCHSEPTCFLLRLIRELLLTTSHLAVFARLLQCYSWASCHGRDWSANKAVLMSHTQGFHNLRSIQLLRKLERFRCLQSILSIMTRETTSEWRLAILIVIYLKNWTQLTLNIDWFIFQ